MKILVLSSMYPNSKIYKSGIFVHEQVKALKKLGLDVVVIAPVPFATIFLGRFSKKWKLYSEIPNYEKIDGVEIFHPRFLAIPNGLLKHYWGYYYAYAVNKTIAENRLFDKLDLIHAHGSLPDNFGAHLLAKKNYLPYILTVHGSSVYAGPKNKKQFLKIKKAIVEANGVIGVSTVVINKIETLFKRKDTYLVHNGFSKNSIENNVNHNNFVKVLFGAALIERKGCDVLLKAIVKVISKVPNLKLEIAGGGILLNKMRQLAHELGIENNVKFHGVVSHQKMLKLMSECDIFVLPSWDEAFGVVYLEAMISKKPIIGTKGEGISDIIIDHENGFLVEAKNISSLGERIIQLAINKSLRESIGYKGYLTVRSMTWERNAELTKKVYEKVLSRG